VGDWSSVTTNGTAQSRTHGNTHELLTAGGSNVTTDVKGNITVLPSNLVAQSSALGLVYDFDNKMKSADVGNNSSVDVEFKYDALGRRVGRSGSSGSFAYVQSDQQTLVDYGLGDAPSSPLYRYVYGSYIDEPIVRKGSGSGGTLYYFHRNQQYSVYCVTSSSAAITERYAYTAYGEPTICNSSGTVIGSSSISNRYAYTGREWDGTVGLYHFRARWMSGLTGRFLTRDPIGYEDTENSYQYTGSRPLISFDPTGTITVITLEKKQLECGGYKVAWIFTLDKKAPEDGYIVQKVTIRTAVNGCLDIVGKEPDEVVFWEAWFVKKGKKLETGDKAAEFTDLSQYPSQPRTWGERTVSGEIKFFYKSITGDLGDPGAAPPIKPPTGSPFGGPNQNPGSSGLPSTSTGPTWWNDAPSNGEKVGKRKVKSSWSCCCNFYNNLEVEP